MWVLGLSFFFLARVLIICVISLVVNVKNVLS